MLSQKRNKFAATWIKQCLNVL